MRLYYPKEGYDVLKRLPGRNEGSCLQRALKLGLRRLRATDSVSEMDRQLAQAAPAKSDSCQEDAIQSGGDSAEMISETDQIDPDENPEEETPTIQFGMMQM